MYIKREIKKLFNCAAALLGVVFLLGFVIYSDNSKSENSVYRNIVTQQAFEDAFEIILSFVKEKTMTEIALNTDAPKKKILKIIETYKDINDEKLLKLSNYVKKNIHFSEGLKFLNKSILEFQKNIEISRKKIIDDLSRENKILAISDWSVFTHKFIQKFKNDIYIVRNKNYFSDMNCCVQNILVNIYTEYTMHNILMYKNIKDYLAVLTANTSLNIESDLQNIKSIIDVNRIENNQIRANYKSLVQIYDDFKNQSQANQPISEANFETIVDSIIPHIKFLSLQEKAYLRTILDGEDNINSLLLVLGIVLVLSVLVFLVLQYAINLYKFSRLTREDIAKDKYRKLGFIAKIMETAKEYIENFSSYSRGIDISNVVPITSINHLNSDNKKEYVSENAFNDICMIVKEINLCNSKIFDNLKYLKEKANSLESKRNKLCDIANFNLKNDIHAEMRKCVLEIDKFYKLDAFESANEITATEFSYLFEKFHSLSFKADNVKNIFLELVSEIKLLTLNSAIENTDSKKISYKLQNIIDNVITKINVVKTFTTEANNTYAKTNKLLASLLKIAKEIEGIQITLENKISLSKGSIEQFFNQFKTICTHYELILANSNIERGEIENLKKVLGNTKLQIENTNTKVNTIISNVEDNANKPKKDSKKNK